VNGGVAGDVVAVLECSGTQPNRRSPMATLSRIFLATLLVSLAACSGPQDASVISNAQAAEAATALYPPLAADADPDGRYYDYH
jgi:hypothetical protein